MRMSVNSWTLLLTVSILCSGAIQAFGYYHPDKGRWLSRDPIGESAFRLQYSPDSFDKAKLSREALNLYLFVNNNSILYADRLGLFVLEGGGDNAPAIEHAIQDACARIKDVPDCLVSARYKGCINKLCSGNVKVEVDALPCQKEKMDGYGSWWIFNRAHVGLCAGQIGNNPSKWGATVMHEFAHLCGMLETHAYQLSDWYESTTTPPTVRHGFWGDGCICGEVNYP
jgi:RHS repeat-associated protein